MSAKSWISEVGAVGLVWSCTTPRPKPTRPHSAGSHIVQADEMLFGAMSNSVWTGAWFKTPHVLLSLLSLLPIILWDIAYS